jgi:ankyrin repeat protein
MKLLIDKNCNVNVSASKGVTAFIRAAFKGHSEFVKLLIDNHCDVNVSGSKGGTALIRADFRHHLMYVG